MSKKYGFGVKLAVAALAVAGVAGTGWADDISTGPVDMGVGFSIEVEDTARIDAFPKSPTRIELEAAAKNYATNAWNPSEGDIGTLGILRVTTNHDGWDITMKTMYGGKLINVGASRPDPANPVCPPGTSEINSGWDKGKCSAGSGSPAVDKVPGVILGQTRSLVYKDATTLTGYAATTPGADLGVRDDNNAAVAAPGPTHYEPHDTVQLRVAIGLCDLGADISLSANATTYYSWGAPDDVALYPPVEIDGATLFGTRQYQANGGAFGGGIINFATTIGTPYATGNALPVGTGHIGDALNGQTADWSGLAGGSFKTPETPGTALTPSRHVQHFYVNVGINPGPGFLEKKDNNGNYEEKFTFELSTNY